MLEGKYKMFYCRLSFHTNTNDGHYDCNGVFLFLKWYFVFSPDTLDANLKYILTKGRIPNPCVHCWPYGKCVHTRPPSDGKVNETLR